jgi:hypothetical protein
MKSFFRLLAVFTACAATLFAADPEVDALLAKARARIGTDEALKKINSIHFEGKIEASDDGVPLPSMAGATVEIIFQKPFRHRMTVSSPQGTEITGLDEYTGWRRNESPTAGVRPKTTVLGKEEVKRLRANTSENLSFYRGLEQLGGQVLDLGPSQAGGAASRKLVFRYDQGVEFIRHFDPATGKLLLTETPPVGMIREEGEMVVDGVRFPAKIIATSKIPASGKTRVIQISFNKITLNETFPPGLFEQPFFTPGK